MPIPWMQPSRRSLPDFRAGESGTAWIPTPNHRAAASGTSRLSTRVAPFGCTRACSSSPMVGRMPLWSCSGSGIFRKPWSSTGRGASTKPSRPTRSGKPSRKKRRCPCKNGDLNTLWASRLREVHPAVSSDGQRAHLLNGRLLRSKRQYRNKLLAKMDAKIACCKQGGKRRMKLIRDKQKRLSKLKHQIQEIEHKQTSCLVNTLHQWSFGSIRHKLTYKAERLGMRVVIQEEIK